MTKRSMTQDHPINQPNTACCQEGVGACPDHFGCGISTSGLATTTCRGNMARAEPNPPGPAEMDETLDMESKFGVGSGPVGVGARHLNIPPNTRGGQGGVGGGGNCYSSKLTSYAAWWK